MNSKRINRFRRGPLYVVIAITFFGLFGLLDRFVSASQAPSDVISVSAGPAQTCAVQSTGELYCWGTIWSGEFNKEEPGSLWFRSATQIDLLNEAVDVSNGKNHTCALLKYGSIQCWGLNGYGELGIGDFRGTSTPTLVIGLQGKPTEIVAGKDHTCALLDDGIVQCWGANHFGQVGNDEINNEIYSPLEVSNLEDEAIAIAAGELHTCALLKGGNVQCWGYNSHGQLGDGTTEHRSSPVVVVELASIATSIAAGRGHTCALLSDGSVQCWGLNSDGQLGDETTQKSSRPTLVGNLTGDVMSISGGGVHTCALLSDGGVQCWGDNQYGQLGDGSTENRLVPTDVRGLAGNVSSIAAGAVHTCAILDNGRVQCWGYNRSGLLGSGISLWKNSLTPKEIRGAGLKFWNY